MQVLFASNEDGKKRKKKKKKTLPREVQQHAEVAQLVCSEVRTGS